ncbi:MAG TPA: alpha/beta fold hydrolase [Candidatus Brocadiia bacterium]|nr:alpha/beta fold hydrolase [Candidatus Brocadiia bacterium]
MLPLPWGGMAWQDTGGGGAPIVFLHGTGCDTEDWTGVFAALPAEIRRVACDFRGHGRSSTPEGGFCLDDLAADVRLLLDALGCERVALAGHSLGGMVAMAVARHDPRVAGLALVEGWVSLGAARAFGPSHRYGGLDRQAVARIQAKMDATRARFSLEAWDAFWRTVRGVGASDVVSTLRIPIVALYGRAGGEGVGRPELMLPGRPNVDLVWVDGAGHYLFIERPAETAQACLLCLRRAGLA